MVEYFKEGKMNVFITGEKGFTATDIKEYLQSLKCYFYMKPRGYWIGPVVYLTGGGIGAFGNSPMSFSMREIAIEYSETIVNDNGQFHPLWSEATLTCVMWTQLGAPRTRNVKALKPKPTVDWA